MKTNGKIFLTLILPLFYSLNILSQGQANWWYFGSYAGVSFQTGNPVSVSGGQINTGEGCATISDNNGNLLFYTDGIKVWNRNHVQMPNGFGLLGHFSATQSGVIVQRPGSNNIYYIFTVTASGQSEGFRWSEVDMTLDGGFGDVTANKNILLYTPATEKICGIRHCNNTDVWVVAHEWNSNGFRSYLVTSAGINPVPVISNVGTSHTGSSEHSYGYMKNSPDGTKLALAVWDDAFIAESFIEVFDFDNSTGAVSNALHLWNWIRMYGVEFSPSSTLLYANYGNPIAQWNLYAGSDSAIIASRVQIGYSTHTVPTGGSLQLGPDNKIYHSRNGMLWLGVINNPNIAGIGCNYVDNGVSLTGLGQLGLPNFIQSYLRQPPFIHEDVNCLTADFSFTTAQDSSNLCTSAGNNIISVAWDFGDPLSGPNNTSTLDNPTHTFSVPGTYNVKLVLNYPCYIDSANTTLTIVDCSLNAVLTGNSDVCSGTCTDISATVTGGNEPYTYNWTPNFGNGPGPHQVCPATTTTYYVTVTDSTGNSATDSVTIIVNPLPIILTSSPAPICVSDSVAITVSGALTYTWAPCTDLNSCIGSSVTATPTATTLYTITGTDANGCTSTASVTVTVNPLPLVVSPPAPAVCNGGSVVLTMSGAAYYHWSPQTGLSNPNGPDSTTVTATLTSPLTYTVTGYSAEGCSAAITFNVDVLPSPVAIITADGPLSFCEGEDVILTASGGTSFLWSDASTSQSITITTSGIYAVIVTDSNNCSSTTSEAVIVNPNPLATLTPNGNIGICNMPGIMLNANTGSGLIYEWYHDNILIPSAITSNYFATTAGSYQVKVIDAASGCFSWTEIATLTLEGNGPVVTVTASPTIGCLQNTIYIGYGPQSVTLTATSTPPAASYLWSTNETTQSISITSTGTYSVTAYDASGCASDQSPESQISINVVDIRCGQGKKKILLCHVPEGNQSNPQTICISPSAIPFHLAHHDYDCVGPCSLYYQRASELKDNEIKVTVYPNPFSNSFTIHLENNLHEKIIHLNLMDITGRIIISDFKFSETTNLGENLSQGVYNVEIIIGDRKKVFKLVKL
jgi:hypothetical protein